MAALLTRGTADKTKDDVLNSNDQLQIIGLTVFIIISVNVIML